MTISCDLDKMSSLDMSLDDMIKNRHKSERGRGQGRARRGSGGSGRSFRGARTTKVPRRAPLGVNAQPSAFKNAKSFPRVKNLPLQNGFFEDSLKASRLETGTKLSVCNLDIGVDHRDIWELFSEIGELISYGIHYDKDGRPSGSAEVLYARRSDAFLALKKYNNVHLDGKPIKIEIVGVSDEIPLSTPVDVVGGANGRCTVVMPSGPGRARGRPARARGGPTGVGRGAGQRFRGRGRGRGRKKPIEDELDKGWRSIRLKPCKVDCVMKFSFADN